MDQLLQTIESVTKTIVSNDVKAKLAGTVYFHQW